MRRVPIPIHTVHDAPRCRLCSSLSLDPDAGRDATGPGVRSRGRERGGAPAGHSERCIVYRSRAARWNNRFYSCVQLWASYSLFPCCGYARGALARKKTYQPRKNDCEDLKTSLQCPLLRSRTMRLPSGGARSMVHPSPIWSDQAAPCPSLLVLPTAMPPRRVQAKLQRECIPHPTRVIRRTTAPSRARAARIRPNQLRSPRPPTALQRSSPRPAVSTPVAAWEWHGIAHLRPLPRHQSVALARDAGPGPVYNPREAQTAVKDLVTSATASPPHQHAGYHSIPAAVPLAALRPPATPRARRPRSRARARRRVRRRHKASRPGRRCARLHSLHHRPLQPRA